MSARIGPIARERRHTLAFLREIRSFSPVFLDTEVDMTAVQAHRRARPGCSVISYVLAATGRVLADHPEANAAVRGRWRPRVARYPGVHGKFTMDRTINGTRVVLSAVLPDLHTANLDEIQSGLDHYRGGDPETMPEFANARLLQRVPLPVARLLFRLGVRSLARRDRVMGTVAITSLGHRAVDGFHSVGGTTVTLGLGRVQDRPVVRDGQVVVAPVMRLSLAFDHRVIDGAEAADVLTAVRTALESFPPPDARPIRADAGPTTTGEPLAAPGQP